MEENKKYPLYNRDGNNIYIELNENGQYELKGDLEYMRVGYADDAMTQIDFIDPSGGPFIRVGYFELENQQLSAIVADHNKYLLIFKYAE